MSFEVHFHRFRKFFLTKASDTIGEHAAHALCGHGFYMDVYYPKSIEERAKDYKVLEPLLTTTTPQPVMDEARVEEIATKSSIAQMAGLLAENIEEYEEYLEKGRNDPKYLFNEIQKRMQPWNWRGKSDSELERQIRRGLTRPYSFLSSRHSGRHPSVVGSEPTNKTNPTGRALTPLGR